MGEVARRTTLPPMILAYSVPRYNTSSIENGICKQGAALWCNSQMEDMDQIPKDWQHGLSRSVNSPPTA